MVKIINNRLVVSNLFKSPTFGIHKYNTYFKVCEYLIEIFLKNFTTVTID